MTDPLDLNIGLQLFIPYRAMETAVLDALREHGHDLPINQARVFQRIDAAGSRLSELAEASQVSKQTIGSIVDQLERAGYVRRIPDPADGRARLVVVADRGREAIELGLPVLRAVEARWRDHLGPTRYEELRRSLASLCEITDPFA